MTGRNKSVRKWGICVPQQTVHCTCIFTFPSSNLILNVENDTPIVGAISQGSISSMYCLMRLLLPTPEITEKKQEDEQQVNFVLD